MGLIMNETAFEQVMTGDPTGDPESGLKPRIFAPALAGMPVPPALHEPDNAAASRCRPGAGKRPILHRLSRKVVEGLRRVAVLRQRLFQAQGDERAFMDDEYRHCVARPIPPAAPSGNP